MEIARRASDTVEDYLGAFRAVVVSGPRQSGKTTLLGQISERQRRRSPPGSDPASPTPVRSFDDPTELAAAILDPKLYVNQLSSPTSIDEFQRAGEPFLLATKLRLDRNRAKGQLVLAGSTSFLTSKRVADSLAGRVGIVELWPLSVGEARSDGSAMSSEQFIDRAFLAPEEFGTLTIDRVSRDEVAELIVRGGFPEPRDLSARARRAWFRSYLATIATKDVVEEVGEVRKLAEFRRVLDLLMARTAQEANAAAIASDADIYASTVAHHVELLRNLLIVHELPAWASSATTRAKRHPKRYAVDTGLAAAVLGSDAGSLADVRSPTFGQLFETFVVNELAKQRTWSETEVRLHHFRDRNGAEIDALLVGPREQMVGIEVKGSSTVSPHDARHLASFRDRVGAQFIHGYVVYLGDRVVSLGPRLSAIPVGALWV